MPAVAQRTSSRWSLVVAAGLAIFMAQLDTTIVNVALPTIRADLNVSAGAVEWVALGYLIPLIALSLLCGRWLDGSGRRIASTAAVTGFGVGSLAVALVPGLAAVVAARFVQGAFASALLALAPVLAVEAVSEDKRGRALGVVSTLAPLGALAGPLIGGQLVAHVGWRAVFFMNLPVVVIVLALAWRLDDHRPLGPVDTRWAVEAALLAAAATFALGCLSLASTHGLPWLAGVVVAVVPIAWWCHLDVSRPVRKLVTARGLVAPHVALLSSYTGLLAVQFLIPFFMEHTLGASAALVGLTLLAYPVATALMGPVSGGLSDRRGPRGVAVAGAVALTLGVALLGPLSAAWSASDVAWRLATVGVGFGLFITPAQSVALTNAGSERVGLASATTNLARQVGLALGPALATLAWGLKGYDTSGMRSGIEMAAALSAVTALAAVFCIPDANPLQRNPSRPNSIVRPRR